MWRRLKNVLPFMFGRDDTGRLRQRTILHHQLVTHFSIDELEQLAFELWRDGAEEFEPSDKAGLVREMILRALREERLGELVEAAKRERPLVEWG